MNRLVIEFSMPDYIALNQKFDIHWILHNPLDESIEVYVSAYKNGEILDSGHDAAEPDSDAEGSLHLVATEVPFKFTLKGEVYSDNVLIALGSADVTLGMEVKPSAISIPLMVGLGSVLLGGLYGKR